MNWKNKVKISVYALSAAVFAISTFVTPYILDYWAPQWRTLELLGQITMMVVMAIPVSGALMFGVFLIFVVYNLKTEREIRQLQKRIRELDER